MKTSFLHISTVALFAAVGRKIFPFLAISLYTTPSAFTQNAIVGDGFSSGWGGGGCPTGAGNFAFLNASAGSSYGKTFNASSTGSRYFRFGIDWSGTAAQRTITPGADIAITPSATYLLNTNCTTSGAMYINVANTAYNYVFKTQDAGANPTGNFVVFEVQGAVRTVNSVAQAPLAGAVVAGSVITVTATLDGILSSGQSVYLRYSANNFSSSTVVQMTGSGTVYSAGIPATVNAGGANIAYYVFTSGSSNVAADGSNADLFTINLNNNGGSNFSYSIPRPLYRSKTAGPALWSSAAAWQISTDNGTSWIDAALTPTATSAEGITIQSGHTINIDASVAIDQVVVQNGAILQRLAGATPALITLSDGAGEDLIVQSGGIFRLLNSDTAFDYINCISYTSSAKILVQTNGMIEVNISAGSEFWRFATQAITRIEYQNNAVFYWNPSGAIAFGTSGITYFPSVAADIIPVFRVAKGVSVGSSTTCTINGLLQLDGGNFTWQNSGTKIIRNGIRNSGTIAQAASSGVIQINGSTSVIGGAGTLELTSAGLTISAGTCTLENNKTLNTGAITINNSAILNAQTFSLSGTGAFTINAGGTLVTGHSAGVNGTVLLSGTKSFATNSNYGFTGIVSQVTGSLMPITVGTLTIENNGSPGNNSVTLSNNNTLVSSQMKLNSGLWAAGTGQNLQLGNGATLTLLPTADWIGAANGGNLWLLANNTISGPQGKPSLYDLTIGSGIPVSPSNLSSNPTVYHHCTINSEGSLSGLAAPYYADGSILIYNAGGSYNRNIEWGQVTAGQAGYPHHVIVQNNTTLNITAGGNPPRLAMAGNLQLGNSSSYGILNMNNAGIPLEISGDLTIGTASSANAELVLSTVFGGDLHLYGNFTRHNNNFFTDNNRATFLKGGGNSTINTPGVAITAGSPSQFFSYLYLDKNSIDQTITLNCPVGISAYINFGKGRLISTLTNLLIVTQGAADAANIGVGGGSANSYADGPMRRFINATNGDFHFPVGQLAGITHYFKGMYLRPTANAGNYFTATYFRLSPPQIGSDTYIGNLLGINNIESWQLDKLNPGPATTARVLLPYANPGDWRDMTGAAISPCWFCNVAVVQRTANSGSGTWFFPQGSSGNFSSTLQPPEYRFYQDAGLIASKVISDFSPFTFGYSFNIVLPVALLQFQARQTGSNEALLLWTIDSDKDLLHTIVEHSTDGIKFTGIDTIAAHGMQYSYQHKNLAAGIHYYRLKLADRNGTIHFSQTKHITINAAQTKFFTVSPNPLPNGQALSVSVSNAVQTTLTLSLIDMTGRRIWHKVLPTTTGNYTYTIPPSPLAAGLYQLVLWQANAVADRRMIRVE